MRPSGRGFTLFELLVVLALLALVAALVPPMLTRGFPATSLKAAAREVAAGLRETRGRAIGRNADATFTVDVEARSYRIGDEGADRVLPRALEIALYTAESELIDGGAGTIRFFADGSSTGGRVSVSYQERRYDIVVDWLTGQVKVSE